MTAFFAKYHDKLILIGLILYEVGGMMIGKITAGEAFPVIAAAFTAGIKPTAPAAPPSPGV